VGPPLLTPHAAAAASGSDPPASSLESDAQAKAIAAAANADAAARLRVASRKKARADALARAAAAEKEAQDAVLERDAAAAHACDTLARAEQERAAAGAPGADDDDEPPSDEEDRTSNHHDLHQALLLHEAAAIANLHAQAIAVQNIRNLVLVVLDLNSGNYNRWCDQFLLTVGKFSLQDNVLQDAPAPGFPDWARMDCVVKSWILNIITDDLAEMISARNATAHATRCAVESQFFSNHETRALYLNAKFRNFVQGDLSITDYCREFKRMADMLGNLGEVVTDRTLKLNVIRGLNERFRTINMHLRRGRPF
jgi:hypothetical protein